MAYYITKDGYRPEELGGDYYFGNPNRSPLLTPYDPNSPIQLSNQLYLFFEHLEEDRDVGEALRKIDPEFYARTRISYYLPHEIYNHVYSARNEYQDFVNSYSLSTYNGQPAFRDGDNGYLVLEEYDIEELEEYEKDFEKGYEEWKADEINSGTPEDEIDEDNFIEYGDYDKSFFSNGFSAGAIWVDYKEGTRDNLLMDIHKIKRDLDSLGKSDLFINFFLSITQSYSLIS